MASTIFGLTSESTVPATVVVMPATVGVEVHVHTCGGGRCGCRDSERTGHFGRQIDESAQIAEVVAVNIGCHIDAGEGHQFFDSALARKPDGVQHSGEVIRDRGGVQEPVKRAESARKPDISVVDRAVKLEIEHAGVILGRFEMCDPGVERGRPRGFAPGQLNVLQEHVLQHQFHGTARRLRALAGVEVPVGPSVGVLFEQDVGTLDLDVVDREGAGHERHQIQFDDQAADGRHRCLAAPTGVGQGDVAGRQPGRETDLGLERRRRF